MGDPLSHPLFAGNTEDMEGHELVEAFRCLREEDKSAVELAVLYKEEGNEWMKKKVKKDLKEAIIRYSHALKFLDEADREASEGVSECVEEEEEPRVVELVDECQEQQCEDTHTVTHTVTHTDTDTVTHTQQCDTHVVSSSNNVLRSQILNNRALASMHLKNYGTALSDINMVLHYTHYTTPTLLHYTHTVTLHPHCYTTPTLLHYTHTVTLHYTHYYTTLHYTALHLHCYTTLHHTAPHLHCYTTPTLLYYTTYTTLHTLHTLHCYTTLHTLHYTHYTHYTVILHYTHYTTHTALHLHCYTTLHTLHCTTLHYTLHYTHYTTPTPTLLYYMCSALRVCSSDIVIICTDNLPTQALLLWPENIKAHFRKCKVSE
jgi:hypothetical protein